MKQDGYFLIKVRKSINLYLWGETKEELEDMMKSGMEIVPYYKDGSKAFLKIDNKLVRIR